MLSPSSKLLKLSKPAHSKTSLIAGDRHKYLRYLSLIDDRRPTQKDRGAIADIYCPPGSGIASVSTERGPTQYRYRIAYGEQKEPMSVPRIWVDVYQHSDSTR
eukprot:2151949-Rhodomonas_salina.1